MLLGIDFGTRKIGLAVVDMTAGELPLPLTILKYKRVIELADELIAIIADYNIEAFVIGQLPEDKQGDEEKRQSYELFLNFLEERFTQPIYFVNEERTTQAAMSVGKENPDFHQKNDDAVAAQIILQTYLDTHGDRN